MTLPLRTSPPPFLPRARNHTHGLTGFPGPAAHPPAITLRPPMEVVEAEGGVRRTRIWEFGTPLHCSIIGTCLTSAELRALLRKFQAVSEPQTSDHDLHVVAVTAAGKHDTLAKQLHKALDRRHRIPINQAAKARTTEALRRYWSEAVERGEIPGAYWAVLTHPLANDAIVREVFGDVHMLSHLVGSANRADIRRLHQLAAEKAALEEKLARQQKQLRDAVVARDARIRELTTLVASRIENAQAAPQDAPEAGAFDRLIADLHKCLEGETRRRERAEARAAALATACSEERNVRASLQQEHAALEAELAAAEAQLAGFVETGEAEAPQETLDLDGAVLLYVGGRPHQLAQLRRLVETAEGVFLHHDGGIEERTDLLPGLVNRADLVVFPVDCISHSAALAVKRLCRQAEKPYVPLRGTGLAALLRALHAAAPKRESALAG